MSWVGFPGSRGCSRDADNQGGHCLERDGEERAWSAGPGAGVGEAREVSGTQLRRHIYSPGTA